MQVFDDSFFGHVDVFFAPRAGCVHNPGIQCAVTPWFAAVARYPVERTVLYKATINHRVQCRFKGENHRPGRIHFYTGGNTGKLGCIGGKVTRRLVDEGERVKANQPLAELDVLDAEQQLFSAKRDLAEARYAYLLARVQLKYYAGHQTLRGDAVAGKPALTGVGVILVCDVL